MPPLFSSRCHYALIFSIFLLYCCFIERFHYALRHAAIMRCRAISLRYFRFTLYFISPPFLIFTDDISLLSIYTLPPPPPRFHLFTVSLMLRHYIFADAMALIDIIRLLIHSSTPRCWLPARCCCERQAQRGAMLCYACLSAAGYAYACYITLTYAQELPLLFYDAT